jgi:hypothetical protein
MEIPQQHEQPKKTKSDIEHTLIKAGLSAIPIVGGSAAELFGSLIVPPLEKRRDEWIKSIAEGLINLQEKVKEFQIEKLKDDPIFVTTVLQATQVALRSHQKEKLEALRNAILNTAIGNAPNDDLQLMFLNFIDSFVPWHLRILTFFQNPRTYGEKKGINYPDYYAGGAETVLIKTFPELASQRSFYDQIAKDLDVRGLMDGGGLQATLTASGMFQKRTTKLGDEFLSFINRAQ